MTKNDSHATPEVITTAEQREAAQRKWKDETSDHAARMLAQADSHDNQRESRGTAGDTEQQPASSERQPPAGEQETGDILPASAVAAPAGSEPPAKELATQVMSRLRREKRWFGQVEQVRDDMMRECKAQFNEKDALKAWVYSELDRMYPPLCPVPNSSDIISEILDVSPLVVTKPSEDSGAIQGLSDLPKGWPGLPANASLSAELGWVQANRLRIVTERPGKATWVHLEMALSPAPSWAALGWLETSIRSYAKFVDVAAKVSGGDDGDESAVMRRERKSIDEVRALLQEMEAEPFHCPHCGKLID